MRAQVFDARGELRSSLPRARPPATGSNPARVGFDSAGNAIVQALERPGDPTATDAQLCLQLTRESPDGSGKSKY